MTATPAPSSGPSSPSGSASSPQPVQAPAAPPMSPGDEAPPGTPGTGENLCRRCGGSGQLQGQACPDCSGTGRVTVGIGGA